MNNIDSKGRLASIADDLPTGSSRSSSNDFGPVWPLFKPFFWAIAAKSVNDFGGAGISFFSASDS